MTTVNTATQDPKLKFIETARKNRVIFNGRSYEALPIFAAIYNSTQFKIPLKDIVTDDTDKMFVPTTQPNRELFDNEDVAVTMYENRYYVLSGLPKVKAALAAGKEEIQARRVTNMVLKRALYVPPADPAVRPAASANNAYPSKPYNSPSNNKYSGDRESRDTRTNSSGNRYNNEYKSNNKFSKRT